MLQLNSSAQSQVKLLGVVLDTTKTGIPDAHVRLVAGRDTLTGNTNFSGKFSFPGLKAGRVSLLVRAIGYYPYETDFVLKEGGGAEQILPGIVLKSSIFQLKEVVIKGAVVPMKVKQDTVEFNAEAYTVRDNDRVEDLLKQLPGVEIDKEGNVVSAGKTLTKIRVNGKDFFTSNVKEFISQLPAGVVSKIQFIDDYGDKANFTGIKTGEPQKMLNLVLKSDRNEAKFGSANASAGTNDRYALNLNGYLWKDSRQIGLNAGASNINTGAGINTNSNVAANYRDKIGKDLMVSGSYDYGYARNESVQESYTETANSLGTIYNNSSNNNSSRSNNHNFDLSLESINQENFIRGGIRGALQGTRSISATDAIQTGAIKQDLNTQRMGSQKSPNLNVDFTMARKLKKTGRNFSVSLYGGTGNVNQDNDLNNQIRYYDPETGKAVKDSLLHQLVNNRNRNNNLSANLSYSEPLGSKHDTLVRRSIDVTYLFSLNHTHNELDTKNIDQAGAVSKVDSLSNSYSSSFTKHIFGVNYRYESKKIHYTLGITAQPSLLTGAYEGRADRIYRAGFNIAPVARFVYTTSSRDHFSGFYAGNSVDPNFNQLQPVRDTRNLQNIIVGNPELRAAFNHMLNFSYTRSGLETGSTLQVGLRGNLVQDQVVSNTILVPDVLDSRKQETHFLNTNGNYSFGSNYYWTLPVGQRKYILEATGGVNYNHRISFTEQVKNRGEGININQRFGARMNKKWIMLYTSASYNYNNNVYSIPGSNSNTIQNWVFSMDSRVYLLKSLILGLNAGKTVNQGYSLATTNPLLISASVEKTFFKDKRASLKLEGNDLLNQGNNLSRSVTDNSVTESRTNQVTRYLLLSFTWRLQSFAGED